MATVAPPGIQQQGPPPVYSPLPGNSPTPLGARLEQMLTDGRRVIVQEKHRCQINREAYRGNAYLAPLSMVKGSGNVHRLAPTGLLPSGQRRDSVNRLRQMLDGRVAMYTRQKPAHEVIPASREKSAVDGARIASRFVDFQWDNVQGWNVAEYGRRGALWAEQDGLSFGCVTYDRSRGAVCKEMLVPGPDGQFHPIAELVEEDELRDKIEELRESDPDGGELWQEQLYPVGEIVLRNVRAGALAFDPNMISDWRDCGWIIEGRRRKIADLEREVGRPLMDLIRLSDTSLGRTTRKRSSGSVSPEDGTGETKTIDLKREVMVYEMFAVATGLTGEWPAGAHILWAEDAPGSPIEMEPWLWPDGTPRGLPYHPFVPRPDGGHLLRTLGTSDELLPVQRMLNRRWSQYGEWLDLVSRPLLLMVGGSLRSKSVFNQERVVHVTPGFEAPRFMQVPPDPGPALLQSITLIVQEMSELAIQSGPVRGQAVPNIDSGVAYNSLVQQGEGQIAGTEAEFTGWLQWTVCEALKNVYYFYSITRQVEMPGVDDAAAFQNFRGSMLGGSTTWRITSSVLPKNKAAQNAMLIQFMQYAGPRFDPTPYAAEILEGDVESLISMERAQGRKQESENDTLFGFETLPEIDKVWQVFTYIRDAYMQAYTALGEQMQSTAMDTGQAPQMNPQQVMQSLGPPPPTVTNLLLSAGHRVPQVAIVDRDALHIRSLEFAMIDDGFKAHHPLVQQLFTEHLNAHLQQAGRRAAAIAMQSQQMAGATPGAQPPNAPPPPSEPGAGQ